jgi:hypothetical protein
VRKALIRAGIVLGALVLAWLSVAVTLSNALAAAAPSLALQIWPGHAAAHARAADTLIGAGLPSAASEQRARIDQAAREAAAALRRDPSLAGPARILALQAALQGNARRSERLIEYSERMSRRDIPTQFWLIENRVAANDVRGALRHFGIALQVAPSTREVLFPVLSSALTHADLVGPIADLVHRGDSWRSDFLYHVSQNADPASAGSLFLTLARLGTPPAPPHLQGLIERLVRGGNFTGAARIYALVDRRWRLNDPPAQLDGDFAREGDLPPFGWELNQNVAWRGERPDRPGNPSLLINMPGTGEDWAAHKLLLLPTGVYRLSASYGVFEGQGGALRVEISCSRGGTVAAVVSAPANGPVGTLSGVLAIPAGCTQQWLTIQAVAATDATAPGKLWLDNLGLARSAG